MAVFLPTDTETDIIEKVRGIYRAYMPEADTWKKPSYHDVNSVVVGGVAFSALNEARNGIDARVNPATAVGPYLDIIAATPPLFLTRADATQASGFIFVQCDPSLGVSGYGIGNIFTTADGTEYAVTETVTLDANGEALVPVTSVLTGAAQNSCSGQPFVMDDGCFAASQGIAGGFDRECDSQLRRRIFAARMECYPTGSPYWYEVAVPAALTGVTRSWLIQDGGMAKIMFMMEDKYPCGEPLQDDIDALKSHFEDKKFQNACFCPVFCAAKSGTIAPQIRWETAPLDINIVIDEMQTWLRENFELGDSVHTNQIQCFLDNAFPEYGAVIDCCEEWPAICDLVYNCAQILGPC